MTLSIEGKNVLVTLPDGDYYELFVDKTSPSGDFIKIMWSENNEKGITVDRSKWVKTDVFMKSILEVLD